MVKNKIKISKEGKKKIEEHALNICKKYAKHVEEEMVKTYEEQIDKFYADPEYNPPSKYIRHEQRGFERGMEKTFEPVYKEEEKKFRGGIKISTDNMYPGGVKSSSVPLRERAGYRGTQNQVLSTFLAGLHGPLYYNSMESAMISDSLGTNSALYNNINAFYFGNSTSPMRVSQNKLMELREEIKKDISKK